jgi:two-component sensor histidine kinase
MRTEPLTTEASAMALWPTPADLIVSDVLFDRSVNTTSVRSETAAVRELSHILDDEHGALLRFLAVAQNVCGAGSAGLSLLQIVDGTSSLRWRALAGALAAHEGVITRRDFSTCGLCLDNTTPLVLERPQRVFDYLCNLPPVIAELLTVPLVVDDVAIGTLWIAHHDPAVHFRSDDARIIERLALHLSWALTLAEKNAEQRRAIEYRDAQIRDAHHRVTNTLQFAAYLLHAESGVVAATSPRNALRAASERLQVLAKVHELLARSGDEAVVLLPPLLQAIVDAAGKGILGATSQVRVRLEVDHIALPGERAIAIALLINEAVTNACKHAFPNGRSGEIKVDVRIEPLGALIVRIADDGIGFSPQARADGLGLRLVRAFAQQLQGLLSFETPTEAAGTVVTLRTRHDLGWRVSAASN